MKLLRTLLGLTIIAVSLGGCGGGGGTSPATIAYTATTLSTTVVPAAFAGNGTVCSANDATAINQLAPTFANVSLPFYTSADTNQNLPYGIGSNGSFAGYAYEGGQSQDVPIYWSSASSPAVALPLPNGLPSMIASIAGTTLFGYTTGANLGGSFGIYQWPTPNSQPTLFFSSFPSGCTINSVFPDKGSYVVCIVTNQAETLLCPAGGAASTPLTDNLSSLNVTATSVGPDGTIYGLSSTGSPVYWPNGSTASPRSLPPYTDPSFTGPLRASEVYVNGANQIVATFIGSDGNFRSCLWATPSSQPFDLGRQPFGITGNAPGQSIAVMAFFDDGSLVARTGTGTYTYSYMTRKS